MFDVASQFDKKPIRPGRQGHFTTKRCPNAPTDSRDILSHDGTSQSQSPQRVGRAGVPQRTALEREEEEGDQPIRVGRKPIEQPERVREHTYGTTALSSVENSERFENTQRHRNHGDIVGHRDDRDITGTEQDVSIPRGGRARAPAGECAQGPPGLQVESSLNEGPARGRQRSGYAPQGTGVSPFATDHTEPEETPARRNHHANHFDHGNVTTGGPMNRTKPKDKTPLWHF